MTLERLVGAGLIALTGLCMVGCGGGGSSTVAESNSAQVGNVVEDYDAAFADAEGSAACALLTAEAQQKVARQNGYGGTLGIDATKTKATCADGIENRYGGEEAELEELKFAPVSDVQVRGSEAQATVKLSRFGPVKATLIHEGEDWKLSSPPYP
jgi:hypothetical protein